MLLLANPHSNAEEAQKKMMDAISSGAALERLRAAIIEQGGNPEVLDNYDKFPQARFIEEIKSDTEGYIAGLNPLAIGKSAILLGAGRMVTTDKVDPSAGFKLLRKKGDKVAQGDIIALAYANDRDKLAQGTSGFRKAVEISDQKPNRNTLIIKRISG
jgi:pyrimidine-nucleoside phosphorylase